MELTHHLVGLHGLPAPLDGLRVVQLTDLHLSSMFDAAGLQRAVRLANAARPDVIVLTGDFTHRGTFRYLVEAQPALAALEAPLGVYACIGNHDHWDGLADTRRALGEAGIPMLGNESRVLADGLWLAAVDDLMAGQPDVGEAEADIPADAAVVCLSHNPAYLPSLAERPWLVLAGHTHGGQISIPGLGPRRTMRIPGWGPVIWCLEAVGTVRQGGRLEAVCTHRYPAGWYTMGEAKLYVNRGLGYSTGMPWRLACPQEIACFTLTQNSEPSEK